jgi:cell fate regulator YaaT (PSP1 superfamily)
MIEQRPSEGAALVERADAGPTRTFVGVRFRRAGRIELADPGELVLDVADRVIVETAKGPDLATVVRAVEQAVVEGRVLPRVLRRAAVQDVDLQISFRRRERDAAHRCRKEIEAHRLPMKLLRAEYAFDGSRLTFYFSADGRVDFRQLVRDLASAFRTRIELRQVGPRDETKLIGGCGRCGLNLCCSCWLKDFSPVSMKMAKNQDLPLTDNRLSGVCGRLMCCLAYENATYG